MMPSWSHQQILGALARGPHQSSHDYINYLSEEFVNMINKGQWIVLPYSTIRTLPGLRISPPVDYSWWNVNQETLLLAALNAMQFGHALERLLREILLSNPHLGPVYLIKQDISDGFYQIALNIDDIPKLGVAFPMASVADLVNAHLNAQLPQCPHHLDELVESIPSPDPMVRIHSPLSDVPRDPSLPFPSHPVAYTDVYVNNFMGAAQQSSKGSPDLENRRRVRCHLLHAIDDVFCPLSLGDSPTHREPISLKKLQEGDCSWGTLKLVFSWIIDTVNMTLHLPPHRVSHLRAILDSFPPSQCRTSIKNWHETLGKLRSILLSLPGSHHIFSTMQHALSECMGGRIALTKGVHDAMDDFRWMCANITTRPTRIAELIPLPPVVEGHHDASGAGAGGIWFPSNRLVPWAGFHTKAPIVWRLQWPKAITTILITPDNLTGTITNSDLE
ncbi:hypothetical protein ACHAXA_002088, partial [Cyclostephanos tholiformis]